MTGTAFTLLDTLTRRRADDVGRLVAWIDEAGGIAHRDAADAAGHTSATRRIAVRVGAVRGIRRHWLATDTAPAALLTAADNTATLTCVSAARWHGWWMPPTADSGIHLRFAPSAAPPRAPDIVAHWTHRIAPPPAYGLVESVEDTLAHLAQCLSAEDALIVWESALTKEGLRVEALQQVHWRTRAARACALALTGTSDSGLETRAAVKLARLGVPLRKQVRLLGRPVDLLLGDRLVIQLDGFAHHSDPAQRSSDVAFDAQLVLMGYTVLRFTYSQVMDDWDTVERTVARAIANGAHRVR